MRLQKPRSRPRYLRYRGYQVRGLWTHGAAKTVWIATLNRLRGSDFPERRAVLVGTLLANFEAERLADLLPEDSKRIRTLERLSRIEVEDPARQTSNKEILAVPVIHGFMLDELNTRELNLALDLILSTAKRKLSRGQALVRLACFYVARHMPVD